MYKKIIFSVIAIVIVLSGVTGLLGYVWQKKISQIQNTPNKTPQLEENQAGLKIPPLPPVPEPQVINSYSGEIIEIAADKLVLATNYGNKTILLDGQTIFEKLFIPKFPQLPPVPGEEATERTEIPEPEIIAGKDLLMNQKIQAFAETNIKDQDQFTADKISLIIKLDN